MMMADGTIYEVTTSTRSCFRDCTKNHNLSIDEWAELRLAEFNLWASESGALARNRASLDARLQQRPEVRDVVLNTLRILQIAAEQCKAESDIPDAILSYSSDNETSSTRLAKSDALQKAQDVVQGLLRELFYLVIAIRRSAVDSRLQKADHSFVEDRYDELRSHLALIIWSGRLTEDAKMDGSKTFSTGEEALFDDIQNRLITANLRRRHRFLYAQKHSLKLRIDRTNQSLTIEPEILSAPVLEDKETVLGAQSSQIQKLEPVPSRFTTTEASVPVGPIHLVSRSQDQTTEVSSTTALIKYPRPPKASTHDGFVKCPCCCIPLDSSETKGRKWREHLVQDLAPYTCILRNCPEPQTLYLARRDWLRHMTKQHDLVDYWLCYACGEKPSKFETEVMFLEHLASQHSETIPSEHAQAFALAAVRRTPVQLQNCPLCAPGAHQDKDLNALLEHIASHVHSFSLYSLPWFEPHETEQSWIGSDKKTTTGANEGQSYFGRPENPYFNLDADEYESHTTRSRPSFGSNTGEPGMLEFTDNFPDDHETKPGERLQSYDFIPSIRNQREPISLSDQLSDKITAIFARHKSEETSTANLTPQKSEDTNTANLAVHKLMETNTPSASRFLYFDLDGPEAARFFLEYAEENRCNNVELLRRLEIATRRDDSVELTGDTKKDLLPTKEKLERFLSPNDTVYSLLCCNCNLCQRGVGFRELARSTRILEDAKKRKELAILILSGCLFALGELCTQADFKVVRFAAQAVAPWIYRSTDGSCFSRIAPVPNQCPHHFFENEDASFLRVQDLCVACRRQAFQRAVLEKSDVVNIPKLQRTSASGQVLFRKVFKYQHGESELISEAKKEALIAMHLARRDSESFVEVLFALTYTDRFYTYVEIVFPFYDRDLGQELEQRRLAPHPSTSGCLLDDPLWKASLDVVRAVCVMHDAVERKEIECSGHFDIKPENIVIKEGNNTTLKLFLIDFGQASAHRAGTHFYQPPEVTKPRSNTKPLELAYDVWSMACVLLEVLVFIKSGLRELRLFRSHIRGNDGNEYAFWQGTSPHDMVLRLPVTGRLQMLEDQGDRRIRAAIRQLRAMLSIFPDQRPTMRSCLGEFQRINLNRQDLGLPTQDLMNCGLEQWKTSYSTSRMPRPNPGNLYFFRDKPDQIHFDDERITLDIESVTKETKAVRVVTFVPHAFFDLFTNPGHTFPCHFDNLHEGFTFHFNSLDIYLEFMSLLTYQRIVPDISEDPDASGTSFKLDTCLVKIYGWPRDETQRFQGGTVQIWRQLSQDGYDRWHKRSNSFLATTTASGSGTTDSGYSDGTRNSIRHPKNAWKLAMWTFDARTGERTCVVVDIGAKTWRLEDPSGERTPQRLKIKPHYGHADFRGAIFAPSTPRKNGNALDDRYPGFPISPIALQTSMRSRLTEVTIDFSKDTHRSEIMHILRKNKFDLPG